MVDEFGYQLLVTEGGRGGSYSRNLGVAASISPFIAFLDDDDWWEPTKIQSQIDLVSASQNPLQTLASSRTIFHEAAGGVRFLPERWPHPDESIGNYLVGRPGFKFGSGFIQTSGLFMSRELATSFQWDERLKKHQDWDLIIRLLDQPGVEFVYTDEPLVHVTQASTGSVSRRNNWVASEQWLRDHDADLSGRARSDFIACHILRSAIATVDLKGIVVCLPSFSARPQFGASGLGASEIGRANG